MYCGPLFRKLGQHSMLSQTVKTFLGRLLGFFGGFADNDKAIYQSSQVFHLTQPVLPQLRFHLIIGKAMLTDHPWYQ